VFIPNMAKVPMKRDKDRRSVTYRKTHSGCQNVSHQHQLFSEPFLGSGAKRP